MSDAHDRHERDDGLPEEIVECLERYRDGRCPELAACLLEELALGYSRADTELERCTCFSLLRRWLAVDRGRRDLPAPRAASAPDDRARSAGTHRRAPATLLRLVSGGARETRA